MRGRWARYDVVQPCIAYDPDITELNSKGHWDAEGEKAEDELNRTGRGRDGVVEVEAGPSSLECVER